MDCPKCGAQTAPSDRVCQQCSGELAGRYAVSPAARDQTTPAPPIELPYAGFWRRVGAFALDCLLLGLLGQALGVAFGERFATLGQSGRWIGVAIAALYVIPAHHLWGQTLGKRALGLRVQGLDGGPVSLSRASVRYLALAVPWFLNDLYFSAPHWPWMLLIAAGVVLGSVLFVGILGNLYLLIFNRPSRRLIHDWVAGTVVVRAAAEREPLSLEEVKVKPIHVATVGLIPVAILALLGWIALRVQVSAGQVARLQRVQEALSRLPGILQGGLVDQQNFGPKGRTHVIAVQLWVSDHDETRRGALLRQAVATIFREYPESRAADDVAVVCRWGFDIGIASLSRSSGEVHSVADWQRMLGGLSAP